MVAFRRLFQTPVMQKCMLAAGGAGLDREVRLVTVVDSHTSSNPNRFKKGNELVLCSSYIFQDDALVLHRFLQTLIESGASGLALRMNGVSSALSESVLDLANASAFPVLIIPEGVVWSDIITQFYELLYGNAASAGHSRPVISTAALLMEASRTGLPELMQQLKELLDIPSALIQERTVIHSVGDDGLFEEILNHLFSEPEEPQQRVIRHRGRWYGVCSPSCTGSEDLLLFSCAEQSDARDMLDILHSLFSAARSDLQSHSEDQEYSGFLARLSIGDFNDQQIREYLLDRNTDPVTHWGMMIISGKDCAVCWPYLADVFRSRRAFHQLVFHTLHQPEQTRLLVMYEICDTHQTVSFNVWLREMLAEAVSSECLPPHLRYATGGIYNAPEKLRNSLEEAQEALNTGRRLWPDETLYFYNDICFYSRFRKSLLTEIDFSDLHMIENSRKNLSFDGISTLEAYLEEFNFKRAGDRLNVHENTMRYRIQKICQLLSLSLEQPVTRQSLLIRIKLWKLMAK